MARNTYGGTVYDVAVNASNPAQLALAANGVYQLFNAAGVLQSDYRLFNTSTSAFDITATTVSVTSGFLPLFQGPDATELYDAAGHRLPHYDNLVSGGLTSVTINGTTGSNFTLTQDSITDGTTAKQFTATEKAFVDSAPTTSSFTAAVVAALGASGAVTAIQSVVSSYLAANSYYPSFYVGTGDPLPSTATQGASLDIISGAVSGTLGVASYLNEAITGATSVTTAGTPTALGTGAVVLAAVTTRTGTATSTSPSPLPTAFAGMGLTWTQVTLPTTATGNGADSIAIYLGKGTGTTVKPTMTFASAPTTVHLRMFNLTNANGTVVQATSTAYATTNASPTINLPAAVGTTSATISVIVQVDATTTMTAGTGYTEVGTALSSTSQRTAGAYALPSRASAAWTTTAGFQKLVAIVEVS